jgi:O-antigen ligase/tetratricopeptide (TPR) repeat protein
MALEKALRWIVLAGVFALPFIPFIVTSSLFFPYITGKNFAFRIIVEIITGAWLALALVNPAYRPKRSWLLGAYALFVLVIGIADAQGVYEFKSFWSNFERMEGWVTLAHLLAYLVVAVSVVQTERLWRLLWNTSLGVSLVLAFHGLFQVAGFSALGQGGAGGLSARVDATFGNPIYLAVYLLFHIFIAALLLAQTWTERPPGRRFLPGLFYGAVIAFDTLTLFFTGTRGTMLGLVGGVLVSALLFLFAGRSALGLRRVAGVTVGVVLVLLGAVYLARDSALVRSVGFLERLATISLSDNTIKARFLNWGIAWKGIEERPLLGWGQENYAIVFDKYYDPRMYAQEQWFDRVHNSVLDWFIAGGILGLLGYLSLFVVPLIMLWRRRNGEHSFTLPERSVLTGLLAGYFFHNLFVFDNITSYILFVSLLSYIAVRAGAGRSLVFSRTLFSPKLLPVVAIGAGALVWASAWFVNSSALAANRELLQAIAPQGGGIAQNLEHFKKAISYGSYGTQEAREQLAQLASRVAGENVPRDVQQQFLDTGATEMALQANSAPLSARFPLFLGALLDAYGNYDTAKPILERAHTLSPGKQSILFELGSNAQGRGDMQGALAIFKQAFELEPSFRDARVFYIAAAIRAGTDALAEELLAPLLEAGSATDVRIAAAYVSRNRYDKIVSLWEEHISARPDDVQARFTLAAAYYATGDRNGAIAELERARALAPESAAQIDQLIKEVREGTARIQ